MDVKRFFKPSWKKLGWFFLVFFVAQFYVSVIMFFVPTNLLQNFINFILNPGTQIILGLGGVDAQLIQPIGATISVMWQYFLATLLAKEISKDKE